MEKLPIYRFVVGEDDEAEVTAVALVDFPAIEMNWQAFNKQFVVEPKDGESQDDFIGRCISVEVGNGIEQDQAAAICYSKWDKKGFDSFAESYTDYPEQASENAKIALRYAEENGWGECGTDVGKQRANQLAKREPISRDTIARMAAFERHRQNSDKELGDGCGRLMWLAWGGDAGIEWAQRKLESIDKKEFKQYFKADKEKRIISGALMVADLPIYRRDEQGEYYGVFTAEDIYNIRNKFSKKNFGQEVNMMHDSNQMVEGVYMIESFLIDSERGIHSPNGFKLPNGSWFGSYKVDNQDVWDNYIKTGEFKGFSVEGVFKTVKIDSKPLDVIEQIIEILKNTED